MSKFAQTGAMMARAMNWIRNRLVDEDQHYVAIYLGRKDDPQTGILVGNIAPQQLHAAIGVLLLDADKLGDIDGDGNLKLDEDKG